MRTLFSRVFSKMTVQTSELMANNPEMVQDIINTILASTISSLVDGGGEYSHLRELFIESQTDILDNYKEATASICLFEEYRQLLPLVTDVIDNIGCELFSDMWEEDESSALSEVLRCFGHGVSFWDKYYWCHFSHFCGSGRPKVRMMEEPWDIAARILGKIDADYYDGATDNIEDEDDDRDDEDDDRDFDKWLEENYDEAGSNASDGEMWYLSKKPTEFMPVSLSSLKEQWKKENPGPHKYNRAMANFADVGEPEPDEHEEDEEEPSNTVTFITTFTTFQIPEHYLPLLFSDGYYTEEDIKVWEKFEERMRESGFTNGHWSYTSQEPYFSWSNDVHSQGCNVVDLQWVEMD